MPPYVTQEICRYIHEGLARFGASGSVEISHGQVTLSRATLSITCPLGPWASTWSTLDEESRRRYAFDLSRTLASGHAQGLGQVPEVFLSLSRSLGIALTLSLLLGAYLLWGLENPKETAPGEGGESQRSASRVERLAPPREDSQERSSRVCAATKARVYRGATVSIADVDGWQVEIAVAKEGSDVRLDRHPSLSRFVEEPGSKQGSKFVWKEVPALAVLDTADSVVRVRGALLEGEELQGVSLVVLSFSGTLVDAYFRDRTRSQFFHIASALSEELDANYAAVYARCFDQPSHALGSWFWGRDAPGAAAALIYFMGMYASPRHIKELYYRPPGKKTEELGLALANIAQMTQALDRPALASLLGEEGGMAIGGPEKPVVISFPFRDGNRASRASRSVSRFTGLR